MPLPREEHEAILNELLLPDTEQSRRTELLQQLRQQHATDSVDFEKLTTEKEKLTLDNADLVVANSKLFRSQGIVTDKDKEKEEEKELSETITIEQIERGLLNP